MSEVESIRDRYARRKESNLYSRFLTTVCLTGQERERALLAEMHRFLPLGKVSAARVLEPGCGSGSNLLDFIRVGFSPQNLVGIDLLSERVAAARERLPGSVIILEGNALSFSFEFNKKFDVVIVSTVFSSILEANFRIEFAQWLLQVLAEGGGILFYDFVVNNPKNRDVRKVSMEELLLLFPGCEVRGRRVTLAPPLSRFIEKKFSGRVLLMVYCVLSLFPFLKTHMVCSIVPQ